MLRDQQDHEQRKNADPMTWEARRDVWHFGDISESARFVKVKFSKHLLCEWSLQPLVR